MFSRRNQKAITPLDSLSGHFQRAMYASDLEAAQHDIHLLTSPISEAPSDWTPKRIFESTERIIRYLKVLYPEIKKDLGKFDTDLTPVEALALQKLMAVVRLSNTYHNLILDITDDTLNTIFANTHQVSQILNWSNHLDSKRRKILQNAHEQFMDCAKNRLGHCTKLTKDMRPSYLTLFKRPAKGDAEYRHVVLGEARIGLNIYGGFDGFGINRHPDAAFHDAAKSFNVLFHESAHILEGFLAFSYQDSPQCIPENIQEDVHLLFTRLKARATIPDTLYDLYRSQPHEQVAFEVGDHAESIVEKKLKEPRLIPL